MKNWRPLAFGLSTSLLFFLITLPTIGISIFYAITSTLEGTWTKTNSFTAFWNNLLIGLISIIFLLDIFSDIILQKIFKKHCKRFFIVPPKLFLLNRLILSLICILIGISPLICYAFIITTEYVAGIWSILWFLLGLLYFTINILKYKMIQFSTSSESIYYYDKFLRPTDNNLQRKLVSQNDEDENDDDEDDEMSEVEGGSKLLRRESSKRNNYYKLSSGSNGRSINRYFKPNRYCMVNACCKVCYLICFVIIILIMGLYILQSISFAMDKVEPIGKLVSVKGKDNVNYKLHIDCRGEFKENIPIIVIDSGLAIASSSVYWKEILNTISQTNRICAYDRAGYGFSESGYMPRTSLQIVEDLNQLLQNSNITQNIILIGHSFGGLNVRLFASLYKEKVKGLLLVDPSHEDQFIDFRNATGQPIDKASIDAALAAANLPLNINRITTPISSYRMAIFMNQEQLLNPYNQQLTESDLKKVRFAMGSNAYTNTMYSEGSNFNTISSDQVRNARGNGFGDIPLVLLTAGVGINGTCKEMHMKDDSKDCEEHLKYLKQNAEVIYSESKDVLSLSNRSYWNIVWGSGHNIAIDRPDVVIEEIYKLLEIVEKDLNNI
ncbi:hypothetical protein ABK040_011385 [Willaertia magna]